MAALITPWHNSTQPNAKLHNGRTIRCKHPLETKHQVVFMSATNLPTEWGVGGPLCVAEGVRREVWGGGGGGKWGMWAGGEWSKC